MDPGDLVQVLLEFLEVMFHQVMFFRHLYPKETFERRSMYGVSVWKSRHPRVCEYMKNVLEDIKDSILNGRIASVQLAMLLNTVSGAQPKSVMAIPQRVPVETFSIRLDYLAPSDGPWDVSQMTRMKFSKILDNFRAAVLRVEGVSGILPERNDGISFEIRVAMRERDPVLQSLWVPVQEGEESIVHTTKIERNTEPMHTETPNEPAAHGVMTTSTTAMSDATPSQLAPVRSFKLSEKCQLHCFFECIS